MRPFRVMFITGTTWLIVTALMTACGEPAPPRDLPLPGTLVARVTDLAGQPVPAAVFDGVGAFTDLDGVATGELAAGPGGFTRLQAPGFAPLWTRPLPVALGKHDKAILTARLTPVEAVVEVDPAAARTVRLGGSARPDVLLTIPPRAFPLPAAFGLTRLRAQDLGPLAFAPRQPGLGPVLQRALWLEGTMLGRASPSYAPLALTVRYASTRGQPTLGRFEPETGAWQLAPGGCARLDDTSVQCTASTTGLWALFGDAALDETGDRWVDTEYALHHALFDETSAGLAGPAVSAIVLAARAMAAASPDLAGVQALLTGAAIANQARQSGMVDALLDEARALVLAQADRLHDAPCDAVIEIDHLRTLGLVTGFTRSERRPLDERIELNLWTCSVWTGWVTYDVPLIDALPGDTAATWNDGTATWRERHAVRLSVDLLTRAVTGAAVSDVRLPHATYRDDVDRDCGDDFRAVEFLGEPDDARVTLAFGGNVAADVWTLGAPALTSDGAPQLVVRRSAQRWLWGGDACLLVEDSDTVETRLTDYATQLGVGFGGASSVSLSAMLTDGYRSPNPLGAGANDRSGFARVTVPGDGATWPFTAGLVSWRFFELTPLHRY